MVFPTTAHSTSTQGTLLVFTLGASREVRRRRLLPARLGGWEGRLHRRCLEGVLTAGREAGCRLVVSSPAPPDVGEELAAAVCWVGQAGAGFGDRLADAERRACEAGAPRAEAPRAEALGGPLLIVGSDAPELSADHLRQALARLEGQPRRVVLGPAADGGVYLLAAHASLAPAIRGTRWCRRDTLRSLRSRLLELGFEVELLAPLADLDRRADFHAWLRRSTDALWRPWIASLRRLLATLCCPMPPISPPRPRPAFAVVRTGRAPPF